MRSPAHLRRLQADLILLLVAIVWGSAFVAQRVAADQMGVFLFNGLRFLMGALILLPLRLPFAWRRETRAEKPAALSAGDQVRILLVGGLLFAAAAFQQFGLRFTTAGNAGFITGLYVVLVPLFLAFGWRYWPRPLIWPASLLAAAGLFLLSTGGRLVLNPGDGLELAGAVLWALHVIFIGRLVQRVDILRLAIGQYLVCGLLSLAAGLLLEGVNWPGLINAWWTVAYTGMFSIGLGYTLQAVGQRVAPAADAAILLSMEAVFAALFGWFLLGEQLAAPQLLGCGLMLAGMLLAQTQVVDPAQGDLPFSPGDTAGESVIPPPIPGPFPHRGGKGAPEQIIAAKPTPRLPWWRKGIGKRSSYPGDEGDHPRTGS